MPLDLISELSLIDLSRAQRMAWEKLLLLTAGVDADEAERIVRRADADRQALQPEGIAA
ncbi:hypothetical protein [Mesorhizobium sp. B2-1-3]|uniref:hypothetical protein n=1 Tax=Mesorhizobium sp. B2-1-3 TaxID=2589972 RepID=UPI0015E2D767|nr:hypothetical protein [Mesorhizobium sp. B2-1-3]